MPHFPSVLPRSRRRQIGRAAHFRRTVLLAGAMAALWLLVTITVAFALWVSEAPSEVFSAGLMVWIAVPFGALIVFDRLQASVDRSCGFGEH